MSLNFYLKYKKDNQDIQVFDINITHNLTEMAEKAGIYYALWRPEEINCKYAKDIVAILEKGLEKLINKPNYYKKFDAKNGWGTYKHFVPFIEQCLEACKKYPNTKINVSR